jgi:hypothetical protein
LNKKKALQLGIPLTGWKHIHNTFILKECNNFKVHHLHFLQIIKAELNNLCIEVIMHQLLYNAEEYSFMTAHQYGRRKGRETINIPVLTAWQIKLFTIAQPNIDITDCDTKACYDRVIPTVSALVQIQAALPLKAA